MSLLVLAYPRLSSADARRIESVRVGRDEPYRIQVPVHFTLVFALDDIAPDALAAHVRAVASQFHPISFSLDTVDFIEDAPGALWYARLTPSSGAGPIAALHDALYTGILHPHLRTDLPYAPHVSIVVSKDRAVCQAAATELQAEGVVIAGGIDGVDVVEYDGVRARTVERIALGGG